MPDDAAAAANSPAAGPPRLDTDPSQPSRQVPHKRANQPFLVHQRWKEMQRVEEERRRRKRRAGAAGGKGNDAGDDDDAQPRRGWGRALFKWALVVALLAVGAGQFIAGDALWGYRGKYIDMAYWRTSRGPRTRIFTPAELLQYNGRDPDKPIYLSVLGNVYDVTKGRHIYGPGGMYDFFAGRDASRAYVTGCFKTHLTHDLRGLYPADIEGIMQWDSFFRNHKRYFQVGRVKLPAIDKNSPIPPGCNENAPPEDGPQEMG